jgi:hypothetical protein
MDGCRLRVFENRVLRRIFGPKRDEVKGVNSPSWLTHGDAAFTDWREAIVK